MYITGIGSTNQDYVRCLVARQTRCWPAALVWCGAQCSRALCCAVQRCAVLYCVMLCSAVLRCDGIANNCWWCQHITAASRACQDGNGTCFVLRCGVLHRVNLGCSGTAVSHHKTDAVRLQITVSCLQSSRHSTTRVSLTMCLTVTIHSDRIPSWPLFFCVYMAL